MKILALCDSVTLTTGFGRVAQNLFRRWASAGAVIDLWGIAFNGWSYKQHPYVNEIFPGGAGGQWYQPVNLTLFLGQLQRGGYTHVWIMQDTFLLSPNDFPKGLKAVCKKFKIHSTLYFPVDAALDPKWTKIISAVQVAVAYTEYGKAEALEKLKMAGPLTAMPDIQVLGHGVDTGIYEPFAMEDRAALRENFWTKKWVGPKDFLMVNVNTNQRRKDVARSLEILAEVRARGVPAKLLMHMAETSGDGLSLAAVAGQLGLRADVDWAHHGPLFRGSQGAMTEAKMVEMYNTGDCYLTTTLGEGWGLGITEALACGLPVAMPMHTSCAEIYLGLTKYSMGNRVIPMAVEPHGLYLENDNTRRRQRTDVTDAANQIEAYYKLGTWQERPVLNPEVKEWLSWDRIAREFLAVMCAPNEILNRMLLQTSAPEANAEGRMKNAESGVAA